MANTTPALRVQTKVSLGTGTDLRVVGDISASLLGDDALSRKLQIAAGASFTITAPIGAFCLLVSSPVTVQLAKALPAVSGNVLTLTANSILYHTSAVQQVIITAGVIAVNIQLAYVTTQALTAAPVIPVPQKLPAVNVSPRLTVAPTPAPVSYSGYSGVSGYSGSTDNIIPSYVSAPKAYQVNNKTPALRVQADVSLDSRSVESIRASMLGDDALSRKVQLAAGASFTVNAPIGAFCLLVSSPVTVQLSTALPAVSGNTVSLTVNQILYHTTSSQQMVITAGLTSVSMQLAYITVQMLTLLPVSQALPNLNIAPVGGLTVTNNPAVTTPVGISGYSGYSGSGGSGTGGGSAIIFSDTAPSSPAVGQLWFDTSSGIEYVWQFDGDSSQWVAVSNGGGVGSSILFASVQPPDPSVGMQWFDTSSGIEYVYVFDGDSYQWVSLSAAMGGTGGGGGTGADGASGYSGYSGLNGSGVSDGMAIPLATPGGFPTSGSWTPGAVAISDTTLVTDAVAQMNALLSLLVPSAPPNLSSYTSLSVASVGNSPLKASGVAPDHTAGGSIPTGPNTAGTSVVSSASARITSASPSTSTASGVGSGSAGVLAAMVNGSTAGNALPAFTSSPTPTSATVGATVMTARAAFPLATPGFWLDFNAQAVMSGLASGWNRVQLTHSLSGNTNEFYMLLDNMTATPALGGTIVVAESGTPTYAYSSGVPHYGPATATLQVTGITMTNLAGETYYNGNPLTFSGTGSIMSAQAKSYANVGISTPIARQTVAAVSLSAQNISINGSNIHGSGTLQGQVTNVNGSSGVVNLSSAIILVKIGSTSLIDEMNIPVTGLGSSPNANAGVRIGGFAGSDTPALSGATAWVQSAALQTYDAAVVEGVLSCNQVNYSVGYLPVGPNYSGHAAAQYVVFAFQRDSRSSFNIHVSGNYAECHVALPGISDLSSTTQWWDMATAYAGAGYPGDTGGGNGSNGCASGSVMNGSSGTFLCTFGTKSSTNSTGNNVYVRFKLTAGQSITALSFTN